MNDRHLLHGAAFARLLDECDISIARQRWHDYMYKLSGATGGDAIVLMKYSLKPKTTWQFTFTADEESALARAATELPAVKRFLALICNRDGVCCVSEDRLRSIMPQGLANRSVSVSRGRDESYRLSGPGRLAMAGTVARSEWSRVLLNGVGHPLPTMQEAK